MDEPEQRLRSALTEMAEGVPPSHHAWADQQRRLALKSRRHRLRPALVAAVAAAVVALIAVPVAVINNSTSRDNTSVEVAAVPMTTTSPGAPGSQAHELPRTQTMRYRAVNGETLATEPLIVDRTGSFGSSSQESYTLKYAYAVRDESGDHLLCSAEGPEGAEINGPEQAKFGSPSCSRLVRPKNGQVYWGNLKVPASSKNFGATFVYVASRPADKLMVREVNDKLTVAQQKSTEGELAIFAVYMETTQTPPRFTVMDADDKVLQNGP
jgi:hypothetical protein